MFQFTSNTTWFKNRNKKETNRERNQKHKLVCTHVHTHKYHNKQQGSTQSFSHVLKKMWVKLLWNCTQIPPLRACLTESHALPVLPCVERAQPEHSVQGSLRDIRYRWTFHGQGLQLPYIGSSVIQHIKECSILTSFLNYTDTHLTPTHPLITLWHKSDTMASILVSGYDI